MVNSWILLMISIRLSRVILVAKTYKMEKEIDTQNTLNSIYFGKYSVIFLLLIFMLFNYMKKLNQMYIASHTLGFSYTD